MEETVAFVITSGCACPPAAKSSSASVPPGSVVFLVMVLSEASPGCFERAGAGPGVLLVHLTNSPDHPRMHAVACAALPTPKCYCVRPMVTV